ncbi:MAG: recombination protein NinG [Burkholderiales bacterium]|nr:recombination protein NinG [Burkholderiales bacterium]
MDGCGVKRCKVCRRPFEPRLPLQAVCGIDCAKSLAVSVRGKAEKQATIKQRRADRERKERLKTRSQWEKEAQTAFNAFIRARDADKPCICCGLPLAAGDVGGAYDCGHYRSVGSAPHLRYDERNAHAQRKQCNRWGAGRAVDYRLGLIQRIGLERVESLEADQEPRKYTADELRAIRDLYREKLREVVKGCTNA